MPAPKRQQGMSISKHDEEIDGYIDHLEKRNAELEAQVTELRQSLIGGISRTKNGLTMKGWARANERLLARQR